MKLGTHYYFDQLFTMYWSRWKSIYCVHLLINHRSYLDADSPIKEFNETNILTYKYTYGYMVRDIMVRAGLKFN